MGVLFAGCDEATGIDVAVKLLKPRYDGELDKDARLLREARIAASLEHPNVVRVLDFGPASEDDGAFIVMELLSGLSLEDELRARGRLGAEETFALIAPLLGAVAAAHDAGIVHRDLKPANIFLAHEAGCVVPKVLDFGVAKAATGSLETGTGVTLGTPEYMSPEQACGGEAGPASDVWALGVTLYRCLAGQLPFQGHGAAVLYQVTHEAPEPLEDLVPPGSKHLALAVQRALSRDLSVRYQDVRELAFALLCGALADGIAVPADPDRVGLPAWARWCAQIPQRDADTLSSWTRSVQAQARPSHPRWLSVTSALFVIAVAFGAWASWLERTTPARATEPTAQTAVSARAQDAFPSERRSEPRLAHGGADAPSAAPAQLQEGDRPSPLVVPAKPPAQRPARRALPRATDAPASPNAARSATNVAQADPGARPQLVVRPRSDSPPPATGASSVQTRGSSSSYREELLPW